MKKIITIVIVMIFIKNYGQDRERSYPAVTPMSPNVAELTKYIDYPVSYYSGTPNINIPLYEVEVDGFKLPINLNYHASGIKVNQEATWVGLGWSLDVLSKISRTIKGADDFMMTFNRDYPYIINGFYDAPDFNISNLNNHYNLNFNPDSCNPGGSFSGIGMRYFLQYDSEPDIFYYNMPNLKGKFILDKSRGAVLFDKSHNIKIEIIRDFNNRTVAFNLTDAEGIKYLYNQAEITVNHTANTWLNKNLNNATVFDRDEWNIVRWDYNWILVPGLGPVGIVENCEKDYFPATSPFPMTTSWCLSKIITKHGREINFNYVQETEYLPAQESCENYNYIAHDGRMHSRVPYYSVSKTIHTGLRLNSIVGEFGKIQFNCSNRLDLKGNSKKLDGISIYNNSNILIKSFKFDYSYFNNDYSGNIQFENVFKRLKLNKLTEFSATNQPLNAGSLFEYFEGDFPAKNSNNVDYWGYQNGRDYGVHYYTSLNVPNIGFLSGAEKSSNFDKLIIGTLKKITYPTKGDTEFKYESNVLSNGFLRSVRDYSLQNLNFIELPVYNSNSIVSHPTNDAPPPNQSSYNFTLTRQTRIKIRVDLENQMGTIDPNYIYLSQLGVLKRISPTPHTYLNYSCPYVFETPDIIEIQGNEMTSGNLEYDLEPGDYEFVANTPPINVITNWRIIIPIFPTIGTPTPPEYGGGIRINEIKTTAMTRKFNYPYGTLIVDPVLFYTGSRRYATLPSYISGGLVQGSESSTFLSSFGHSNYTGYDWVEEYITDIYHNISKTKYSFFNDTENDRYDDSFSFSPAYINYKNGFLKSIEKFKNSTLVEKSEFTYNSTYSNIINAFIDKNQAKQNILFYNYTIEWPLKSSEIKTIFKDNGDSVVTQTDYTYNSKDLLQSTTTTLNNTQITQNYKYPFDFSSPINTALIDKNMIGLPIKTETFRGTEKIATQETIFKDWGNHLLAPEIVKSSKGNTNLEVDLKYNLYDDKGNILEVEKPSGMKVCYIWGYNKTQPIAKLENCVYSQIPTSTITTLQNLSNTGTEIALMNDLINLRNSLPQAMITTFTYRPLIGVSTITDPKGDKITYSYDSFGRLVNVKDKNGNILSENEYHFKP